MEIKEIMAHFEASPTDFPYDAIEDAIRQKERIIPELFKTIESPNSILKRCETQAGYMGHMYALFLLAQFRIPELYPCIFKICEDIKNQIDLIGDDFIIEDLPRIVASVYNGDPTPIQKLIENRDMNEYLREAMLRSLFILAIHGKIPHKSFVEYCTQLFHGKLEREESIVWGGLASICAKIGASDLLGDLKKVYMDGLVDPTYIQYEEIEDSISKGWERQKKELVNDPYYQLVEDVSAEMDWWGCFNRSDEDEEFYDLLEADGPSQYSSQASHRLETSSPPKVGRNQPCPCGSGKKYKKCCGNLVSKLK